MAARSDVGSAALRCFIANLVPDLVRVSPKQAIITRDIWLLTHHNVRRSPVLLAAMEFLPELVKHTAIYVTKRCSINLRREPLDFILLYWCNHTLSTDGEEAAAIKILARKAQP